MDHPKYAQPDHPIDDLLAKRWSPYAFSDREVSDADLASLLEAARWAPSSYNEQPWRYMLARRRDREAFDRALSCLLEANQQWARHASVLLLGVTMSRFSRNSKPNAAARHDLGLASASLSAEATARGICVHQMIGIDPDRVREAYGLPEDADPLTALAIGYAGQGDQLDASVRNRDAVPRTRNPIAAFVFEGAWDSPVKLA